MKGSSTIGNSSGTILSISPLEEDHQALKNIFRQCLPESHNEWTLLTTSTLKWAARLLRRNRIPIAICERDLPAGTWRDLLGPSVEMRHSPLLIVTSRLADERLWAEVLNLGGWDVLMKPFDKSEVVRVIESAFRHWREQHQQAAGIHRTLSVAG